MELERQRLDALYTEWNHPEFISPDPLETLKAYPNIPDREVAGLLAAAMAYGRVSALLVPLKRVLAVMGESPLAYVCERSESDIAKDLEGTVHRFARPEHMAALLAGAGGAIRSHGSLEAAFLQGYSRTEDVVDGLTTLTGVIRDGAEADPGHLLPNPEKGSACKRLLLFLRWMVRRDSVDPGGWDSVNPAHLLLPLDTWTYRIALQARWTERKSADMKTVREVSSALSILNPDDPIRYDFALSRFGIRSGLNINQLFSGTE
jgi:uncharacterized protein (TIGR02757 family)